MYWFKGKKRRLFTFQLNWSETLSASPSAELRVSSNSQLCRREQRGRHKADWVFFCPRNPLPHLCRGFNVRPCSHMHSRGDASKRSDHRARRNPDALDHVADPLWLNTQYSEVKWWLMCILKPEIWFCDSANMHRPWRWHLDKCLPTSSAWHVHWAAL